jgi:hypothetical protein
VLSGETWEAEGLRGRRRGCVLGADMLDVTGRDRNGTCMDVQQSAHCLMLLVVSVYDSPKPKCRLVWLSVAVERTEAGVRDIDCGESWYTALPEQ